MEFQILGALRVADSGSEEVTLAALSQRRLLARLVISADSPVSSDRLAEDLQLSEGALRTAVSRLRKAVGDSVVTESSGYALRAGGTDSRRFETLLDRARVAEPTDRVTLCDDALDLWRGNALTEFADEDWARPEVARLEQLRVLTREMRVEAKLDLERHAEVVSEVEALIADHPFRDEPRRQLMVALDGSGRRTEALRAFQDYRRLLNDEVGTEPGQALWDLDAEIAKQADVHTVPSAARRPGQLPNPATAMIGRKRDIEAVSEALEESRIVTLSGVGGVGKTRLALEVARPHGTSSYAEVCFVDLSTSEGPDGVASAVAAALGLPRDLERDAIADSIIGEELLLVLDNCEHVVTAAAELVEGLSALCPRLSVLATSREGLAVPGERIYAVAPLTVDSEAVELFEARARAADHSFELTQEVSAAVVEVCRTLDGIPLAIELAAARVRSMSVADIASRLDDRFKLLSGVRRTGIDRHRTLAAAVVWSYDLLDQDEQVALLWLGSFVGEFSFADAVDLLARAQVADPDACVLSLTDKSLLARSAEGGGYRILDTIRHFSLERQPSMEAVEASRAAHAEWVREVNVAAAHQMREEGSVAAAQRMIETYEDLVAAVHWALEHDRVPLAVELLSQLDTTVRFSADLGSLAREVLAHPGAASCPGSLVLEITDVFDQYAAGRADLVDLADRARDVVDRLLRGEKSYVALQSGPHVLAGSASVEEGMAAVDRLLEMMRDEEDELGELHVLLTPVYVQPQGEYIAALERFLGRPGYAVYQANICYGLSSAYLDTDAERAVELLKLGALAAESMKAPHLATIILARLAYLGLRSGNAVDHARFTAQLFRRHAGLPHRQRAFVAQRWFVIAASLSAVGEYEAAAKALAVVDSASLKASSVTAGMLRSGSALLHEQPNLKASLFETVPAPEELPDLATNYINLILSHFPEDARPVK